MRHYNHFTSKANTVIYSSVTKKIINSSNQILLYSLFPNAVNSIHQKEYWLY